MLLFWVIVIVMTALTLALILPTLLKPNQAQTTNAHSEKRAIYRQQFEEIAQDQASGILDNTQYETAKSELERRMLDEIGINTASASIIKPDYRLAMVLLLLLPLASIAIYYKIGNPSAIAMNNSVEVEGQRAMAGNVEPLLATLKAKLEQNPADGKGWMLLARTYVELERIPEAVLAYENAVKVISNDPQLLADYADALAVANNYDLTGKPEELANQALKLDPHHVKSLLLAAAAATNRKDYKLAITHWQSLQKELPADSQILPKVQASLDEAYRLAGVKASASKN